MSWNDVKLDEVILFKNGKKRPIGTGKFPVYGGNGILGYADSPNNRNCVIVGRVGAYCGSVYYEDGDCWISDNAICALPKGENDIIFLYYLLKSLELNKRHIGTSQPLLTQEILNSIVCKIPAKDTQFKIGRLLRTLDEKIAVNQKINDNLYAQAKAIFAQRFIGIETIPDGWKKGNLLDIANYLNGLAMQKFRPRDDEVGLPVLKIKELRQGSCDVSSELCSPSIKPEYIVHDGDVIFSWSGSLLVDIWCGGTCGLNQHLFKVTSETYDQWFYYLWTAHHLERFIAIAADKATTMGHIKRGELEKAEVLIPSEKDYKEISSLMNPLFNLIIANRIEARKLAELRDELLPKLMSGEIDVSEVSV